MSNKKNQLVSVEVKDYAYYREERRKTVKDLGFWDTLVILFKLFMGVSPATRLKVVYFLSATVLVCAIVVLNVMSFVSDLSPSSAANTNKALKAFHLRDSLIKAQVESSEAKVSPSDMIPPSAPKVKSKPIGAVKTVGKSAAKAAPVKKKNTYAVPANALQYIQMYKHLAISEMRRTGIPASITLAQGLLESNVGKSSLAKDGHNHFGVKCGGSWRGKRAYKHDDEYDKNGRKIKSAFRVYEDPEQGFRDHSEFLFQKRYSRLFSYGKDYEKWAHGLKAAGYASDKRYGYKLTDTIKRYKLYQYD